ncbi:hypothetical protein ACROYT_G010804 [Oculina patagonica]
MVFGCFYDKFPLKTSSNFLKNCNFKMFTVPLYYESSGGKAATVTPMIVPQTSKNFTRTKSPSHKMRAQREESDQQGWMHCQAYVTGERYNIHGIRNYLSKMDKYKITFIPEEEPNVLRVCIKDENGDNDGEVFFFRWLGSLVLWNVSSSEKKYFKKTAQLFQEGGHEAVLIETEDEQLLYSYSKNSTTLNNGRIILNENSGDDIMALEKYAFSNALALSVKLAIWECVLDQYVQSIRWVPEDLRKGIKVRMSRKEVLEKTGELISLRYKINLSSDLLMTPDFYWDRENLENLYDKTCFYLDIHKRTRVMNEKLNHCSEMVELLRTHLSEKHSFRLEWGIIALIAVEVVFETLYLIERCECGNKG